jgi:RNA polymerase sigma-70 factor (ECF subfamily)
MDSVAKSWQPTRHTLLSRLKDWQDQSSWREFFNQYWKLIYSVAIQAGLSETEAQDVVQETVVTVAKQMPGFRYDRSKGSFRSWLCNTTRWRIQDELRKRQELERLAEEQRLEVDHAGTMSGSGFEEIWNQEWEQHLVSSAIERVRSRVDPREYQVFDLCTVKGWAAARGLVEVHSGG